MKKRCSRCKSEKDINLFGKNKFYKDGFQHSCRACRKEVKDFKTHKGIIPSVENIPGEVWKNIQEKGFEKLYAISSFGRVKSIAKIISHPQSVTITIYEKIKKSRILGHYLAVSLNKGSRGERKTCLIHRLKAQAFIANPLNNPQVNHIDGNKLNNDISNLEWTDNSGNQEHAIVTGLKKSIGENHPKSKLTLAQVKEIRVLISSGEQVRKISKLYGVTESAISGIKYKRNWKRF